MKLLIKNKFVSTCVGVLAVFLGLGTVLPISNFSVYITSYIHYKHAFVTMHYGYFINLIFTFAQTLALSLGGYLENLIGFFKTIVVGFIIAFIANFGFIFLSNIWLCYILTLIIGVGAGIATSLLGKNVTLYLPDKKGIISGVFGFGVMIIASIFALSGEKIINYSGQTLNENQNYYDKEIADNTYKYFIIGIFLIPIGLIFSLLLIYEYKPEENTSEKEKAEENLIAPEEKEIEKKEDNDENKEENNENKEEKNENKEENNENKEEKNENKEDNNENKEKKIENKEEKNEESEEEKQLKMKISKEKLKKAIKTFRYWRITLISFFLNISISFMLTTGRTFGALIGINGTALQFSGIIQTFAVVIVGPALGILVDKKGALFILRIIVILSILPSLFLAFFMTYTAIFISCFVIYILLLIGLMVSFGPFIMEIYGIQESVLLGGIINGFSKFSDVITTVSAFGFSLKCGENKDCLKARYKAMYLISSLCCGISALFLFFEKKDKFDYGIIIDEDLLLDKENKNEKCEINPDEGHVEEN